MSHILEATHGAARVPDGGLHGIDPRMRVVVMAVFAVVVVTLDNLAVLCAAVAVSLVMAVVAHLPMVRTLKRVAAMDTFIILTLLMLPFTVPGEAMLRVGPLVASWEGFWQAVAIALKANAIVLALLALVGTMEAITLGQALSRLRAPEKLVHLLFFTVRYVEVLGDEYRRLRVAMKARAFHPRSNLHTWRTIGYLLGMLLVRSLERSERVLAAMKCRGYTGRLYVTDAMVLRRADIVFALGFVVVIAMLIGANGA